LPTCLDVDRKTAEGRLETIAGGAGTTEGTTQAGGWNREQRSVL